jgi:hypothetical protein
MTYGVVTIPVGLMTRAASTDSWASYGAIAVGDQLTIDTVFNLFRRSTAGVAAVNTPMAVAMGSAASATTVASTTSVSILTSTVTMKVFVRAM